MKKFLLNVGYLASLVNLLYLMFILDEINGKHIISAVFSAMVIITVSIQREDISKENQE